VNRTGYNGTLISMTVLVKTEDARTKGTFPWNKIGGRPKLGWPTLAATTTQGLANIGLRLAVSLGVVEIEKRWPLGPSFVRLPARPCRWRGIYVGPS
jgi:hypothetical protein